MDCIIREATFEDLPGILSLYSIYITETTRTFEYEVPTLKSFEERFLTITEVFPWLVCESEGKLAGYTYASAAFERAAYQWDADLTVYLDRTFYRKGIATALYTCLIELLRLQGYYNLYAVITANNTSSVDFHRACGFTDIGVFHNSGYKMGTWLDVLWMEKTIAPYSKDPPVPLSFRQLDPHIVCGILNSHGIPVL
jgi:phosphinothricin acetyltransferase